MDSAWAVERRTFMRVSVYKAKEGVMAVLVEASVGSGLAPVMVGGVTLDNIQEKVLPVVNAMRRPKRPRLDPLEIW